MGKLEYAIDVGYGLSLSVDDMSRLPTQNDTETSTSAEPRIWHLDSGVLTRYTWSRPLVSYISLRSPRELLIHLAGDFDITVSLSADGFFNLGVGLLNSALFHTGSPRVKVSGSIETSGAYPNVPLHGLVSNNRWKRTMDE